MRGISYGYFLFGGSINIFLKPATMFVFTMSMDFDPGLNDPNQNIRVSKWKIPFQK